MKKKRRKRKQSGSVRALLLLELQRLQVTDASNWRQMKLNRIKASNKMYKVTFNCISIKESEYLNV